MSFYNLNGNVVEIKGPEDLYFHDVLRIPNWPTQKAADQHRYNLNAAQNTAVLAFGIQAGAALGATSVNPNTGGAYASTQDSATGSAASGLKKNFSLAWPGAAHFMLRLAEGIAGIVLLAIGLNALLKQTTGVDAAGTAIKAAKVVK